MLIRLLAVACLLASTSSLIAEDWPTFRGQGRDAISSETGLLDSWAEEGPELAYRARGAGRGYASPAVAGGRMFTLGDDPSTAGDSDEFLTCFDFATGKQLWMQKTGPAWDKGRSESWKGSRGTPTVAGDMVFVITPFGKLIAANIDDGQVLWRRDLKEDFAGKKGDGWGYSESPLVDGDRVICTPGGSESTVVALNKKSGDLIWSCSRPEDVGAGHSSAVISYPHDRKVYVQNTAGGPMGIDAETGRLLWEYDMDKPTAFIPTPVISDNYVFSVAGYGRGGALLEQVVGEDDSLSVDEIYGPNNRLSNKHGGVVLLDGFIYGGAEDDSELYCAELMTGDRKWKSRVPGRGSISLVAADGKLFLRAQNGTVSLVTASEASLKEISSFETPGSGDRNRPSWAHPVIADGKLLLREGDSILCYDISKPADVL